MAGGRIGGNYDKVLASAIDKSNWFVRVCDESAQDWPPTARWRPLVVSVACSGRRGRGLPTKDGARVSNSRGRRKVLVCSFTVVR